MAMRLKHFLFLLMMPALVQAQGLYTPVDFIRNYVNTLASPGMCGRGYVKEGREKASAFLQRKFSEFGLKPAGGSTSFVQAYSYPVNTFPGQVLLSVNGTDLKPGIDYITDAGSASMSARDRKVKKLDLQAVADSAALARIVQADEQQFIYLLEHLDTFCSRLHLRQKDAVALLPAGCYLLSTSGKLTWTVARQQQEATVMYVKEDALPRKLKKATVEVLAKFVPQYKAENVIGVVPGTVKDTFLVFSAHYDHLGMMGDSALFPGASDNASGTGMLLYLASFYARLPSRYSMLFIAFSGEEAGIIGSEFYISHPVVPLERIKFLTNIDIMGDATDGITVVNATEYPVQFAALDSINKANRYLPAVKSRGRAANSDHYYFTEAGVPAFFIYSNGGKGYYHDIMDKPGELNYINVEGVVKLLTTFVKRF